MTHQLTTFTSTDISRYMDSQREVAIDRLYTASLAQGLAMEAAGTLPPFEDCYPDWEPDAEEAAQIEAHERTRAERWSALTTEEQDEVIAASEAEYVERYDRGWR